MSNEDAFLILVDIWLLSLLLCDDYTDSITKDLDMVDVLFFSGSTFL